MKRWEHASELSSNKLELECERSKAMFTDMDEYKKSCGNHDVSENERHVRGAMFAFKKAFEKIADSSNRVMILEDDVALPDASVEETKRSIQQFLAENEATDLSYVGHCFDDQCLHAVVITPEGAKKACRAVLGANVGGRKPVLRGMNHWKS